MLRLNEVVEVDVHDQEVDISVSAVSNVFWMPHLKPLSKAACLCT
jgi:hypothetical protein